MPVFIVTFRGFVFALLIIGGTMGMPRTTIVLVGLLVFYRLVRWMIRASERLDNWKYRRNNY